jgi:hypothetical protein
MVHKGPRPEHRKGTSGRPWIRYRNRVLAGATHCANCGQAFITNAPCTHPTHAHMPGCPTHPRYPTLEHPQALIDGGAVTDPANGAAFCSECNLRAGSHLAARRRRTPLQW